MWSLLGQQIVGALAASMAGLVGRGLIAGGVGFVTYTGITVAVGAVKQNVVQSFAGIPGQALSLVGYLWLDKGITLVFSCIVASLAMKSIGSSVKKAVLK